MPADIPPLSELAPYLMVLALLVTASAFFSGTEVAMFSLRRVDREAMQRSNKRIDKLLIRLLERPRRLIATILIGNESVNISVSVVMASLVEVMFAGRSDIELALLATGLALPLLLLFGEITPKTVAIKTSVGWARKTARPLWLFGILVTPIRIVVRGIAEILVRPFIDKNARQKPVLGEDEFRALVDAGSAEGQVDARERRIIHNVFELGDKTVAEAMVPRDKVFALSYSLPMARLIREIAQAGYSRVPVYQRTRDNIRGLVYAKDLVIQSSGISSPRRLSEILHEPLFVVQTMPLERLFRIFKQRKTHMALVVNEYGKLAGLVTMEDVLEEVFGEIRDEREHQKSRTLRPRTEPVTRVELVDEGGEESA